MIPRPGRFAALAAASAALAAALVFPASPADARPVTVTMKDGRTIDAELIRENPRRVVLEIVEGVQTSFERDEIASIETRKTMEQVYRERRAELEDDDIDGRYELAYFLFQNRAYDLAETELTSLLEQDPDAERAQRLLRVLEERRKTAPRSDDDTRETDADDDGEGAGAERAPQPEPLTDEQISLIRLWEMPAEPADIRELRPRVTVPREVVNDFIENYRNDESLNLSRENLARFRSAPGFEQLIVFMQVRAREYYDDVLIRDDPPAMREFRRTIHPAYVWSYFIPRFGKGQIPGFHLIYQGSPLDQNTVYTNFLVLDQFTRNGQPAINRSNPEESLLLQWGLPRDVARYPAPDVAGWRPYFAGTDDARFQRYADWIESLFPDPRYGVSVNAPREAPAENTGNAGSAGQ